jgi:hypothetical protein
MKSNAGGSDAWTDACRVPPEAGEADHVPERVPCTAHDSLAAAARSGWIYMSIERHAQCA